MSIHFLDQSAPSLNPDTHAPSPHKKRIRANPVFAQHCGCGITIIFLCNSNTSESFTFTTLPAVEKLHQDTTMVHCSMCVSAVIRLDLNLLLTFKLTKTNTDEQQMPHAFFCIPSIHGHISRVGWLG